MAKKAKNAPAPLVLEEDRASEVTHADARWYNVGLLKKGGGRTRAGRRFICFEDHERDEVEEFLEGEAVGRVLIAPAGNAEYEKYVEAETSRYDKLRRRSGGSLPLDLIKKILYQAWARHILLDWDGIAMPDGEMPDYGPEVGYKVAKTSAGFRDEVTATASELSEEVMTRDEEDAEELGNGSSGSSDSAPTRESSKSPEST